MRGRYRQRKEDGMGIKLPGMEGEFHCERLTERHLQALWYDVSLRPSTLHSSSGEVVRVLDPGEWNQGPGPDFRNATLEIGASRERLQGDVEMHLRPSDWTLHGHGGDSAYANVVAHVTWADGAPPPTLPPKAASISMAREMDKVAGFSPECIDLLCSPFSRLSVASRPCRETVGADPDMARRILTHAGGLRLKAKARRFAALLESRPRSRLQIMYEELMGAFGYRRNSRGFRFVAEIIPLEAVTAEPYTAEQAFLAAGAFVDWDRRCVRPNNAPEKRLASAAAFFAHRDVKAFADATDFSPEGCRAMLAALTEDRLLGRARAAAMMANVLVPMALAEGRLEEPPAWLPPEDMAYPMRLTAFRMFGPDHNPAALYSNDGVRQQGLIQIHREFCLELYPDCGTCSLVALGAA